MDSKAYSSTRLFFRCFLPSSSSVAGGVIVGVVLVGIHILFFSLNLSSLLPAKASDQWILTYTDFIIRPTESIINNARLNTFLTAVLWGVVGLVIYSLLEAGINTYNTLRADKHTVQMISNQKVVLHPLKRTFILRALWRLFIGICWALLLIATGWVMHAIFVKLDMALLAIEVKNVFLQVVLGIAAWTVLVHFYVVLLRLFLFRTRVFGEIIQ